MEESNSRHGWMISLGVFVVWMLTGLGAIINALAIREAVLSILAWVRVINAEAYRQAGGVGEDIVTNFGLDAIDYFLIFILAIAAVAFTIWFEYYFRKGRPQGLLLKRIGIVVGVEIGIFLVAQLIRLGVAQIL